MGIVFIIPDVLERVYKNSAEACDGDRVEEKASAYALIDQNICDMEEHFKRALSSDWLIKSGYDIGVSVKFDRLED